MNSNLLQALLQEHVPGQATAYCFRLWQEHPFIFRLRKARVSKVGDFSCRPGKTPRITINNDSPPLLFLITYIHEVAHLVVHHKVGRQAQAHGPEWKQAFRELMNPILHADVFPSDLLAALKMHLHNPRASSFSDGNLSNVLRRYDHRMKSATLLSQIPEGSQFEIRGRWFTKGEQKRTRVVCCELKTKRNYLIPASAPVGPH